MRDLVWFWFGGFDLIWEEGGGSTRGEKGIFGFERRMETPPPLRPGLGFKFPLLFFFFNQISYSGFFYIVVFAVIFFLYFWACWAGTQGLFGELEILRSNWLVASFLEFGKAEFPSF